uniref:RNA transcription, translation and transport factor protein n=1 Tax=Petromyzon marinus TaxID=7757 RepID=S4RXL4_PETMA
MFRRKLSALEYHDPASFNHNGERGRGNHGDWSPAPPSSPSPGGLLSHYVSSVDETEYRNFIVWLEDQKIRHYKIEDRGNLRNIHSTEWPGYFEKYLADVCCPFTAKERAEVTDWLLGLGVRLEYGDNGLVCFVNSRCFNRYRVFFTVEKYNKISADSLKSSGGNSKPSDHLTNLDVSNQDVKAGVSALANLLQIPRHDDYLVMLKAVHILVQQRLSTEAIAKANESKAGIPIALDQNILGFDTGDATVNEAARILRLLHIEELRELQTKINEAIVAVQAITADPKTDQRLGKVGR